MKKRMSRILSILLVSALVVSTGSVVQAEDVEEPAAEVQLADETEEPVAEEPEAVAEPVEEVKEETPAVEAKEEVKAEDKKEEAPAEEAEPEEKPETDIALQSVAEGQVLDMLDVSGVAKDLTTKAAITGKIPLNTVVTGQEDFKNMDVGAIIYYNTSDYKKGDTYQYGYAEAVKLYKGSLLLTVSADQKSTGQRVTFGLYRDANLMQAVDGTSETYAGRTYQKFFNVPVDGTYYIGVSSQASSGEELAIGVGVSAISFDGRVDRTLTDGQWSAVGQVNAQKNYFKFTAKKTGYIQVIGNEEAKYYKVALFDKKKKALSKETNLGYAPTYGVTKGKTYYVRVSSSGNYSNGFYCIKVANKQIKEKSGKTKKKAVTVKRKGTRKGNILAGSGQADWYKLKKTNKKRIEITLKGATNDKLKITVYKGSKKYISGVFKYNKSGVVITGTNWTKGTYHIKIERGNKKSFGWYSLTWK